MALRLEHLPNLYTKILVSLTLVLMLIPSDVLAAGSSSEGFCENYDWGKVEELVEPYLDDASLTTLIAQGISAEYNTSIAAYQAMHSKLPEEIYDILSHIVKYNCP